MRRLLAFALAAVVTFVPALARADELLWLDLELGSSNLEDGQAFGLGTGFRFGPVSVGGLARLHTTEGTAWQVGGVGRWHFDLPPDIFVRASPYVGVHALYTESPVLGHGVETGISSGLDLYLAPSVSIGLGLDLGELVTEGGSATFVTMFALRTGIHL